MKIAFLLYPTSKIRVDEDTSFWIMYELRRRGHEVFHFESRDLCVESGRLQADLHRSRLHSRRGFLPDAGPVQRVPLTDLDALFIRKEPPFNNNYLYALQMLEGIKKRVFVLNDPSGIALSNEKLFICDFPDLIPETLVTEKASVARRFIESLGTAAVLKPLNEKAGAGIVSTAATDKNLPSLLDISTCFSTRPIMVQKFIRGRGFYDKRILLLNGEVLGAFARKPSPQDFRSNLSAGGSMHRVSLNRQDRRIVQAIAPELLRRGLYFVGIDLMDKYLTEINLTSPSGIPEINSLYRLNIQKKVADFIEANIRTG